MIMSFQINTILTLSEVSEINILTTVITESGHQSNIFHSISININTSDSRNLRVVGDRNEDIRVLRFLLWRRCDVIRVVDQDSPGVKLNVLKSINNTLEILKTRHVIVHKERRDAKEG